MNEDQIMQLLQSQAEDPRPFKCACCFSSFDTHDEKIRHMEDVHGYSTLELTYVTRH